jgi:putative transposase
MPALNASKRLEHSETKMAPAQRWEKGAFLPRMPESLEQLDLLLLTVAKA